MQRVNVTYRPQAIADLQEIYRVIAEASQSDPVATGFVQRIMARCRKIGDVPNGGRPRDDLEPGLRMVPFEHTAIIAYRVTDHVEILNVFYGGRDYESLYHAGDAD
ncbi:type II toxin-antitoxin system RelE/ParE family toxin (plasmid) [Mesorhizobium loti]|uniref:Type II toxin-antitoxin system RelE/ParE family toxin n=1 Tax=Mesorhizobium jarvisii TaxID=1777867 RepID=A0A6M7TSH5_9HYPH|nr:MULTISPECIES: type II toxin-antitoxin system RelE/ParE family toxin [Mesorhizobium]OBQ66497.1 plasmid stabilization protein [Mesorhizobium loti]QKC67650.1 type II toxin-antitoxin system RelE/ParE family toxin [Mesorhizobium jarvisii]QKD13565.1 type II toxin-antitoxin system RelE/ParE family toxin [Mesorhizobium loti]RJT28195.1 type II toxin-antitoxin system RelE/ParE family toxin [Mesorhizobium jarvisii]